MIDIIPVQGRTALQYAARQGHWPVIRCLLAYGDSVNTQDAQVPVQMSTCLNRHSANVLQVNQLKTCMREVHMQHCQHALF